MKNTNTASLYFNENWQKYQQTVKSNTLYHREMSVILNDFINERFGTRAFSLMDAGCGDCSTLAPVLAGKNVTQYIGIDGAKDVLHLAEINLAAIPCEKQFICGDMANALKNLSATPDIIFTSYALHHLSHNDKFNFIQTCQEKLNNNGYFLMVDGVFKENQTRDEWLDELAQRIQTTQSLSNEEVAVRMQHPRKDDFPETISVFKQMAKEQKWQKFEILMHKDIYAFMLFAK